MKRTDQELLFKKYWPNLSLGDTPGMMLFQGLIAGLNAENDKRDAVIVSLKRDLAAKQATIDILNHHIIRMNHYFKSMEIRRAHGEAVSLPNSRE